MSEFTRESSICQRILRINNASIRYLLHPLNLDNAISITNKRKTTGSTADKWRDNSKSISSWTRWEFVVDGIKAWWWVSSEQKAIIRSIESWIKISTENSKYYRPYTYPSSWSEALTSTDPYSRSILTYETLWSLFWPYELYHSLWKMWSVWFQMRSLLFSL
jgi:hypothetical protein